MADGALPFDERSYLIAIGVELERVRKLRGLSREALAEAAGVHPNTVGTIERGERDISVVTQKRILSALGCVRLDIMSDGLAIILDERPGYTIRTDIQAMPESIIIGMIGSALHEARERVGLSLEELSLQVGVHRNSLWNYEHGLVVPTCLVIYRLYRALGIFRISPNQQGIGAEKPETT